MHTCFSCRLFKRLSPVRCEQGQPRLPNNFWQHKLRFAIFDTKWHPSMTLWRNYWRRWQINWLLLDGGFKKYKKRTILQPSLGKLDGGYCSLSILSSVIICSCDIHGNFCGDGWMTGALNIRYDSALSNMWRQKFVRDLRDGILECFFGSKNLLFVYEPGSTPIGHWNYDSLLTLFSEGTPQPIMCLILSSFEYENSRLNLF